MLRELRGTLPKRRPQPPRGPGSLTGPPIPPDTESDANFGPRDVAGGAIPRLSWSELARSWDKLAVS
jgi:hypothetical protein